MLALFMLAAPHSIAVTQGAFIAGCVLWVARIVAERRFLWARTPVDLPLALFVGWTVLSVLTSFDPAFSASRLRGVSLFFILYLFASNVRSTRYTWVLSLVLAVSVVGNLGYTYVQRAKGQGIKITSMAADSPLAKGNIQAGDTIVSVDGRPVSDLAAFDAAFDDGPPHSQIEVRFMRGEEDLTTSFRRKRMQQLGTGAERLGIDVAPGRDFRARAFFSHPATYAETLQLIGAMIAAWVIVAARRKPKVAVWMALLGVLVAGALVQTETRAPIVALGLAVVAMVLLRGGGRRYVGAAVLGAVVLVAAGGVAVLRGRDVNLVDPNDGSTTWRLTVWREAIGLVAAHPVFGIGPDAAAENAEQWKLFDNGKLPPGHFHSTPIQLAVDRGLPALAFWVWMIVVFFLVTGRLVRRLTADEERGGDWRVTAATLGAWGAWVGFVASSMVHLNWGDSEPMEIAWALMGLAMIVLLQTRAGSEKNLGLR
jgi:hypothetical protein